VLILQLPHPISHLVVVNVSSFHLGRRSPEEPFPFEGLVVVVVGATVVVVVGATVVVVVGATVVVVVGATVVVVVSFRVVVVVGSTPHEMEIEVALEPRKPKFADCPLSNSPFQERFEATRQSPVPESSAPQTVFMDVD